MPIPKFQELFVPLLELASRERIKRQSATEAMADHFNLTDEERQEMIPSGGMRLIASRTGWAMTFLTKAGLIEKVERATYAATDFGKQYRTKHPDGFNEKDLRQIEGYEEAWNTGKDKKGGSKTPGDTIETGQSPEEQIGAALECIQADLSSKILKQLSSVAPYQFEQIVIDLLFAMGYGGSREEAAKVTKKSNDEGIDGVINEDRLGLDVIYVQAKRWKDNVGRKEIQSFVGALAGQQANKGVFITTSNFRSSATQYAKSVSQKVILINGTRLADLMIEHNIGVSTVRTIAIKRLDSDYFED